MDISAAALAQARIYQPDNVELRRGSFRLISRCRFDLIVLSRDGHHLYAAETVAAWPSSP